MVVISSVRSDVWPACATVTSTQQICYLDMLLGITRAAFFHSIFFLYTHKSGLFFKGMAMFSWSFLSVMFAIMQIFSRYFIS